MNNRTCSHCGDAELKEVSYLEKVSFGRRKKAIDGFLKTQCGHCGFEFITMAQLDANHDLLHSSSQSIQALSFPGLIRSLRETWGLTQRQLSKILGAGDSAVGKWETGQVPSGPTALLIQCATHVPGAMGFLSSLADVDLMPVVDEKSYKPDLVFHVAPKFSHRRSYSYPPAANSPLFQHRQYAS